ncbi:MAG: hypothetical protein M5Z89_16000 [Olivibacter sp.]|nr:hypothetical protein [Olivibacter sp. UJ_SKK_5.1]
MFETALNEFITILERYMKVFGLYSMDISSLAGSTRDFVKDLKESKTGPTFKTLVATASVFNLKYYQFGNPNFPIPKLEELPSKTVDKINWRKKVGVPEENQYNKLDLNRKVLYALEKVTDKSKFLASEVFSLLDDSTQKELKTSIRITGLFSDELKDYVEKIGESNKKGKRGRPGEYYKLTKPITKSKSSK